MLAVAKLIIVGGFAMASVALAAQPQKYYKWNWKQDGKIEELQLVFVQSVNPKDAQIQFRENKGKSDELTIRKDVTKRTCTISKGAMTYADRECRAFKKARLFSQRGD
jgi:hypothetical protein